MLALMYRHAAEYAGEEERRDCVLHCETAARRAIELDREQADAQVALVSVLPLFGNWEAAHDRLSAIAAAHPDHAVAAHDLAVVEMSTGRVRAAKTIMDRLIGADGLAAIYGYKSAYQNWSIGELNTMDRRADSAIQLWPTHPAIWTARFWTLAYTGRAAAAARMLAGSAMPPQPPAAIGFLRDLLAGVEERSMPVLDGLCRRAEQAAGSGPAQAINSLFALGLIGDVAGSRKVVEAYFHAGRAPVPNAAAEPPVNEMRRRLTQILFTPAGAGIRASASFRDFCERSGLTRYWEATGRAPDFERKSAV